MLRMLATARVSLFRFKAGVTKSYKVLIPTKINAGDLKIWPKAIVLAVFFHVAALGTVTAFGYLAGHDADFGWFASGGMAIHTAIAFALCGSTIVSIALPRDRPWSAGGPAWLPLPVFVGI